MTSLIKRMIPPGPDCVVGGEDGRFFCIFVFGRLLFTRERDGLIIDGRTHDNTQDQRIVVRWYSSPTEFVSSYLVKSTKFRKFHMP